MMQTEFRNALLDPAAAIPAGLVDPQGRPAGRRFDVYRNNVAGSLTKALEGGFPVIRKIVGDAFFSAMSLVYLRTFPPTSRLIMLYGGAMPEFLSGFPPVANLPYLPDVARLELALRSSYHAADASPIAPGVLAEIGPDARLRLAPALRLVQSGWPVHTIWTMNTTGNLHALPATAEAVLVLRPAFDPDLHLLTTPMATCIRLLNDGQTIAEAAEAAGPDLDLAALLRLLAGGGAIIGVLE
jgi:hypothetical protein